MIVDRDDAPARLLVNIGSQYGVARLFLVALLHMFLRIGCPGKVNMHAYGVYSDSSSCKPTILGRTHPRSEDSLYVYSYARVDYCITPTPCWTNIWRYFQLLHSLIPTCSWHRCSMWIVDRIARTWHGGEIWIWSFFCLRAAGLSRVVRLWCNTGHLVPARALSSPYHMDCWST
jgi:hypothetical protein